MNSFEYSWWTLALRGLMSVVFGTLLTFSPNLTVQTFAMVFAGFVLLNGLISLGLTFDPNQVGWRGLPAILESLVGIVIGVATLGWFRIAGLDLLHLIAFWAVFCGILELISSLIQSPPTSSDGFMGFTGVLSVVFGLMLVVFPFSSAIMVAGLIGLYTVICGLTRIVLAFLVRTSTLEFQPKTRLVHGFSRSV